MKYHTEDGREFRTLGRAMEHCEKRYSETTLYWVRNRVVEDVESYIGNGIDQAPGNVGAIEPITVITRQ